MCAHSTTLMFIHAELIELILVKIHRANSSELLAGVDLVFISCFVIFDCTKI